MKEYSEEDFLMLSGIQHFAYCRRQWALIHIEQQWQENIHTAKGELIHKKAHDKFSSEKRNGLIIARGMPVFSKSMGISGECDVVEFHAMDDGISLFGRKGFYRPFPVEYKKGKPKDTNIDVLQLVAQVMCLEEMFSTRINEGAVYYDEVRRRERVIVDDGLREEVKKIYEEMHQLYDRKYTPRVKWHKGCTACSLKDICIPKLGRVKSVKDYINEHIQEELE